MPVDSALTPNGLRVPFGRRGGKLVAPADVGETGLACDCTCPGCGAQLLIRQGRKRRHFAHHGAPGSDRCVERSIHATAMQILLDARWLTVPAMVVTVKRYSRGGEAVVMTRELCPQKVVRFDVCRPEVTITSPEWGTIRPDVVGYRNEKELLLEVCYTHAVDAAKLAKVRSHGRPAVEIYVGDVDVNGGFHALEQQLLYGTAHKHWLHFPGTDAVLEELNREAEGEVERINQILDRQKEKQRLRTAELGARLHQLRLKQLDAENTARTLDTARFKAYRDKPVAEKERALRTGLSIGSAWPYHLDRTHADNGAIAVPHRLWQAGVFKRFVFGQPLRHRFNALDVIQFVDDWFGRTRAPGLEASRAIHAFLAYLKGCDFLRFGFPENGSFTYVVEHNELKPFKRRPEAAPDLHRRLDELERSLCEPSKVEWAEMWPEYKTVRAAVTKWLSMSQKDELLLLDTLFENRSNLPAPMEFALLMREKVPLANIFDFLRRHGFVC